MKFLLSIFLLLSIDSNAQIINTIAGNGNTAYSGDGGPVVNAGIPDHQSICFDVAGNYYISDAVNHVVRKVDTNGIITKVAGTVGLEGWFGDGGQANLARLSKPAGLQIDTQNNLYIAEQHGARIRKVDLNTGIITTIAGIGIDGFYGDGGPATLAKLYFPSDLLLDGQGNLLVTDQANNRIRKINLITGIITTIAGDGTSGHTGDGGPAISAGLSDPYGLAKDLHGNIYVSTVLDNYVRKIDAVTGIITTVAGNGSLVFSGDGGAATSAGLYLPFSICLDACDNLYIADWHHYRIRKVDVVTGIITTIAGNGSSAFSGEGVNPLQAGMLPQYILIHNNILYVNGNYRVRNINLPFVMCPSVTQTGIQCNGGIGSITAIGINGVSPYQYQLNNGPLQPNGIFTGLTVGSYLITIHDSLGNIFTQTIIINEPTAIVASSTTTNATCNSIATGSATISANGGTPGYTYSLDGLSFQPDSLFNNLPAGNYVATVKDTLGCIDTVSFAITELPPYVPVTSVSGPVALCGNDSLLITVTSTGSALCQWSTNEPGSSITIDTSGVYTVTCIDTNGCSGISNTITVTQLPPVSANFTYSQIDNYNVGFINSSANADSVLWVFPGNVTDTTANATFNFPVEGNYNVMLIAYNGCGADTTISNIYVDKLSGINENNISTFNLYPNPAGDNVAILLNATQPINGKLQIVNTLGQVVYADRLNFNSTYTKTIDVSSFASGLYMVSLQTGQGSVGRKLVVE